MKKGGREGGREGRVGLPASGAVMPGKWEVANWMPVVMMRNSVVCQ